MWVRARTEVRQWNPEKDTSGMLEHIPITAHTHTHTHTLSLSLNVPEPNSPRPDSPPGPWHWRRCCTRCDAPTPTLFFLFLNVSETPNPKTVADSMEWLRLVGSLKLRVSFAECSLFYRALLQKRPVILWSLLIVVSITPYTQWPHFASAGA